MMFEQIVCLCMIGGEKRSRERERGKYVVSIDDNFLKKTCFSLEKETRISF